MEAAIRSLGGAWSEQPLASLWSMPTRPWPHQLALALALVQGLGTRALVADAVGLGKTLTAGVVLAELAARAVGSRALILVPAGLREQWRAELAVHAGIHAEIVDAAALIMRRDGEWTRPHPWAGPGVSILSMDFAKQPTVLAGLVGSPWDLLIVDEAHLASGESARAAAVARIASISRVVVALTATPHSGDRRAFHWLLTLGGAGEPMLWFRRERADVGVASTRRTRSWRVRSPPAEARMLDALRRYARHVERQGSAEARLAMIVLRKRALSSAFALGRSLARRRALLAADAPDQFLLPFELEPGEADTGDCDDAAVLARPGLPDRSNELSMLDDLIDLSREAQASWAKWRLLSRLLRRTSEPIVVFTEYRDTLEALALAMKGGPSCMVLHGGLPREIRSEVVARFTGGDARVLIATDVAAEGLNLHARCRLVVNIELPWSPTRLEQRAGRVDRMGQSRPVHVWTLTGASGHESMVVAALGRRADAIRADLTSEEPSEAPTVEQSTTAVTRCEIGNEARTAWDLVVRLQELCHEGWGATRSKRETSGQQRPVWIRLRRRHWTRLSGVILVFSRQPIRGGDALEHVVLHVQLTRRLPGSPSEWLPQLTSAALPSAVRAFDKPVLLIDSLVNRERALRASSSPDTIGRWQPSFFDRRADRVVNAARADRVHRLEMHDARLSELSARTETSPLPAVAIVVE
jgi:superfamily II DNA or RNA helicase